MTRVLNVRVETKPLLDQAGKLEALAVGQSLRLAAVEAVNAVARRADTSIRRGAIEAISLTDAYVRSKTDLALATAEPRAEITVRGDLTILGRYPREQLTQPAGPDAKGDASRGVPAGRKQAGLRVGIKRAASTLQPRWFTMRLRAGRGPGENIGVFVRTGSDRKDVKHIYGPAPYSLFRYQAGVQLESIADDLRGTTDAAVAKIIEKGV